MSKSFFSRAGALLLVLALLLSGLCACASAGTEDGGYLSVLAEKVRRAADRTHLDYDGKRFSPHVTVARVQGPADVKEVADRYSDTVFAETEVDTVRLMRSVLLPSGARHTVVESIPLL